MSLNSSLKICCLLLTSFIFYARCSGQVENKNTDAPLNLTITISLPGISGRIDHMAYNSKLQVVYVAALGNNTVEVVDIGNKKVIHSIKNLSEPQGIRYVDESNSIFVANGGTGDCNIYNADNYQLMQTIKLDDDADNVRYSPSTKKVYVGYGEGAIAVIDAVSFKKLADIKLPAHPESFQLDENSRKIFVNLPNAHSLDVIDMDKNTIIGTWEIEEASSNFPMALDTKNSRLFIGCRNPAKLLVIDSQTGKTVTTLNTDGDTDDVFFDSDSGMIMMSCGDGYIDVFKQIDKDKYQNASKIATRSGARTSLFIPELKQLIVAARARSGNEAELLIYNFK